MLDRSLLSLINSSARLFPPAIPKETYVYFHPNGEVGENKQISAGDILSPYQSSLIHAISLFVETGSDYTEKSKTYQFALNNLFYFPIYYVKGAIAKPDSPDYTMEGFLNFHIFRALMLMMTRHSPQKARECKYVIDGVKIVFNSFLLEDEGQDGSLYNIAMSGIIAEHTSVLAREPDIAMLYREPSCPSSSNKKELKTIFTPSITYLHSLAFCGECLVIISINALNI
jgi:hypothetical protein